MATRHHQVVRLVHELRVLLHARHVHVVVRGGGSCRRRSLERVVLCDVASRVSTATCLVLRARLADLLLAVGGALHLELEIELLLAGAARVRRLLMHLR